MQQQETLSKWDRPLRYIAGVPILMLAGMAGGTAVMGALAHFDLMDLVF